MRDDRLVLCYHALSRAWPAATAVRPEDFADQVALLAARGYRGVSFSEAIHSTRPGRVVAVTFDDAHASVLEHAFDVLVGRGWPATVFVPTGYVGDERLMGWVGNKLWMDTPWAGELRCMSWPQLGTLADAGWELGSHTCSHAVLPHVNDAELSDELEASRAELEARLGRPCTTIAYPYGAVDTRVSRAAEASGYTYGAATRFWGPPQRMTWPRVVVSRTDGLGAFGLKTRPSVRRVLARPRAAVLKAQLQVEDLAT